MEINENTTIHEFFENIIPQLFEENKDKIPKPFRKFKIKVGVLIFGEQQGNWIYHYDGGRLTLYKNPIEEADITFIQSYANWHEIVSGKRSGPFREMLYFLATGEIGEVNVDFLEDLEFTETHFNELPIENGQIRLLILSEEYDDWSVIIKVGAIPLKDESDVDIIIQEKDLIALQKGELHPQDAYMMGKIELKGDIGYLMGMVAAFMM